MLPCARRERKPTFVILARPALRSAALKALVVLCVGLLAGAMLALFYANLDRARGAYPRGVMAAMQHHYDALRAELRGPQCAAPASLASLRRLRLLGDEIEPAFIVPRQPGAGFEQRNRRLLGSLDAAIASPPADCQALNTVVKEIGDHCEACHAEHR
jgi:hypothetical protein